MKKTIVIPFILPPRAAKAGAQLPGSIKPVDLSITLRFAPKNPAGRPKIQDIDRLAGVLATGPRTFSELLTFFPSASRSTFKRMLRDAVAAKVIVHADRLYFCAK